MFGFLKKWLYSDELQRILAEEEELIKEWFQQFSESTSRISTINPHAAWEAHWEKSEAIELREIWEQLSVLHRESRKIEEIRNLITKEEQTLTKKERGVLAQLRRKLDWNPIKLRKREEAYIESEERWEGTTKIISPRMFDKKRYKQLIKELTYDEITFWEYLFREYKRLVDEVNKGVALYSMSRQKWKETIDQIDSNNPDWWKSLVTLTGKRWQEIPQDEVAIAYSSDMKKHYRDICLKKIQYCNNVLNFFRGANQLLSDIKARLNRIKPT